ncbi:hypothetical protein CTRC966_03575 [Chlamydia trachomatis RC-J/966]|nr:hypothetical protein G9768_03570 [Chlamydia trachomatis G/9768]ADH19316.1 hypothetical protein G11222_03590 [Chlamydia trachomatis G/11222]ADH20239.1 hypothetical protein G11074_03570 [Chlamydia trachomatis G/11074]ADH97337.1 hypothetical protein CTG9301_03580 [Chlamydia trachomatis G/9301]AGR96920.1 hypothetical protein CTRC943_03565 [Chlamydia trachomatis RC-J/943]AGR97843.1 hypothetical protein CTRC953_03565 [Chlamydia trachomatis RC-J/953]AGS00629.1 hypothetical protein CTRC122_03610 [
MIHIESRVDTNEVLSAITEKIKEGNLFDEEGRSLRERNGS